MEIIPQGNLSTSILSNSFLKKYDSTRPAYYNLRLLELEKNDHTPLLYIQRFLLDSNGAVDELTIQLGIKITRHPKFPLMILNYDHVSTPHDSLIGLECRGLVIEDQSWNVVAKPMNRFFNWGEIDIRGAPHPNFDRSRFDFTNCVTQSKEDGSLMVMYYYNDTWMLNTRTYFLNDVAVDMKNPKVIMGSMNEVDPDMLVREFVTSLKNSDGKIFDTLQDLDPYLNQHCTYCFEFCSKLNKVVRNYDTSSVYLLAIINNLTLTEFPNEDVNTLANTIGALRPKDYQLNSFDAILKAMKDVITKDPSLEGFVIRDCHASRWKIKSPSYFFLHHISYDKMRTPLPQDLVRIILQGEGTELFSILETNGFKAEVVEIKAQWEFCEERLKKSWEVLLQDWEKVIGILDKEEFDLALLNVKTPLVGMLKELFTEKKTTKKDLEEKWQSNSEVLLDKLFTDKEKHPRDTRKSEFSTNVITKYQSNVPPKTACVIITLIKTDNDFWKTIDDSSDGIAAVVPYFITDKNSWYVECHCGKQMSLYSVPEYLFQHRCLRYPNCGYCKGDQIDKSKFQGKMSNKVTHTLLIYQCECGLHHSAHQTQKNIDSEKKRRPLKGKPMGIPCSEICLVYRHLLHEEMDKIMDLMKYNKDLIYNECASVLNTSTELAHVGVLSISQCRKLIYHFRDMRGAD